MISVLLAVAVATIGDGDVDLKEVERVLATNEAAMARIATVRATLEIKEGEGELGAEEWKPLEIIEVVRDGRRELVGTRRFGTFHGNQWISGHSISASLYAPTGGRSITNNPAVGPAGWFGSKKAGRVSGGLAVLPAYGAAGWYNAWKAQAMLMPDPTKSYRDLLATCSVRSFSKGKDASGSETWDLELRPKDPHGVSYYKFSFSADRGCLATRQETGFAPTGGAPIVSICEVVDFWDVEPGLALPKTIRARSTRSPGKTYVLELKGVQVNQPVDPRETVLEFPEGAGVVDERQKTYHLWGKGEPAYTFESAEEYLEWSQGMRMVWSSGSLGLAQLPGILIAIGVLSAGAIGAVIAYRRTARRSPERVGTVD